MLRQPTACRATTGGPLNRLRSYRQPERPEKRATVAKSNVRIKPCATHTKCPRYLRDMMQSTIVRVTRSALRSHSDTTSYVTSRLRTKFTERAFSLSGPAACNSLPADLRTVSDITDFKNKLKTYLLN